MYTIDTIPFLNYGLYISTHKGQANLLNPKSQFFTIYGNEGYEITKRKGNLLSIQGYIVADDLTDFNAKVVALQTIFSNPGERVIVLDIETINCFNHTGFKIDRVRIYPGNAFGRFKINLTIVSKGNIRVLGITIAVQEPSIITNNADVFPPVLNTSIAIIEPIITTI